jgi:hypothetical protein
MLRHTWRGSPSQCGEPGQVFRRGSLVLDVDELSCELRVDPGEPLSGLLAPWISGQSRSKPITCVAEQTRAIGQAGNLDPG